MGKKPEVRMSEGTAAFLVIAVIAVIVGAMTSWYGLGADNVATVPTGEDTPPVALQLIPAIEKTNVYLSTYDQADFDGEGQKNRVVGTAELVKSGVSIDTVTTSATGAVASTAQFNGGDKLIALGDAVNYYAMATELVTIDETLKPIEVFVKAAGTPDVYVEDDNGDAVVAMSLAQNEVSKTYSIVIERPGDDSYFQFCGIAANYNDDIITPRVKVGGSYEDGLTVLNDKYDELDAAGYDAVWAFDEVIKNFDELSIDFLVGTEDDSTLGATALEFAVFDCENNIQNGKVVYTVEDSADVDVGLAHIVEVVTVTVV